MKFDYTVETHKTVDEAAAEVERLTAELKFRVLAVHDVSATVAAKGFDLPPTRIIEVCNAKYAYEVLKADPLISLMLPCPISVYTRDGKTWISMMLPTAISEFYPDADLGTVPAEVEAVLRQIVDRAK